MAISVLLKQLDLVACCENIMYKSYSIYDTNEFDETLSKVLHRKERRLYVTIASSIFKC